MSLPDAPVPSALLEILLAEDDPVRARVFDDGLSGVANVRRINELSLDALRTAAKAQKPDILIISSGTPDAAMLKVIEDVSGALPMPIVVFVEVDQASFARRAVRAGASGYVVSGLAAARVLPVIDVAMERFRLMDALHKELSRSKSDLEARKIIERAKGLLMQQRGVSEHAAYEALRKMAMARGKPLREIAETIVAISNMLP